MQDVRVQLDETFRNNPLRVIEKAKVNNLLQAYERLRGDFGE